MRQAARIALRPRDDRPGVAIDDRARGLEASRGGVANSGALPMTEQTTAPRPRKGRLRSGSTCAQLSTNV
jgi:hypothetical protein